MDLKEYIGKVVRVKIIEKIDQCYIAKIEDKNITVYIKDEEYLYKEEVINEYERCIILEEVKNGLIGFLLTNRKFVYDLNKIEDKLKKEGKLDKVKDIYLMERLKYKGKIIGLYLVDEGNIGKYYLDDKEIGIYNKKIRENNILFKEKTIEQELQSQIKDVVRSIDLAKKEISLNLEKEKEKHLIEKELGLEEGQITRIATIDLKQKVYDIDSNKKEKEDFAKNQFINIKEDNTVEDVNIKQEMKLTNRVTDMKNLGQVLDKAGKLPKEEGKNFTKIGIIESTQRDNLVNEKGENEKVNTTRYSLVAIANDGTVKALDIEQDYQEGNNPMEKTYQVSHDGSVKQDDVLSRFKIGEGTISLKNGQYGEIEAYHSPRKTLGGEGIEGNKSLDRQLETSNVWQMKKEERELAEEYGDGYRSVEDSYKEAKSHEDDATGRIIDQDKIRTKDVDGDINTKSHVHDNVDYNELAVKWGYYKEGTPNYDKAKELFEEKRKENPTKDTKQVIDMVTEELEEEYRDDRNSR